jgi:hypothetical protein
VKPGGLLNPWPRISLTSVATVACRLTRSSRRALDPAITRIPDSREADNQLGIAGEREDLYAVSVFPRR